MIKEDKMIRFSMGEWRKIYDKAMYLGERLKDSRPTYTEEGDYIAPVALLDKNVQIELEKEIKRLTKKSARYLDHWGYKLTPPLWIYDKEDKSTWISAKNFKYSHLLLVESI